MSTNTIYLVVMLTIVTIVFLVSVPSLFFKKCTSCGIRNGIEARTCKKCGAAFPEES